MRLPGRESDGERQAVRVAAQVKLGGEAPARAAQRLPVLSSFAPAACWWARTTVASTICRRSSAAPLAARAANTASKTPRSRQRAKRRHTVFHFPYRSGMARQLAPSRARHRMPSRCRRFSRHGLPRSIASSGPTISHSASVRSPEATSFSRRGKGGRTTERDRGALRPHGLAARRSSDIRAAGCRLRRVRLGLSASANGQRRLPARLRGGRWQGKGEGRTLAGLTLDGDVAAQHAAEVTGDSQSETGPAVVPGG